MAVVIKNIQYIRNELINSVSHDLRIPISRLRFALELLKDSDQSMLLNRIEEMENDVRELEGLVDEVLNTMDTDIVEVPVQLNQCELKFLLLSTMSNFKKIANKKIIVSFNENHTGFRALANEKYLIRVFQNLLDNANKFASSTIQVSLQKNSHDYQIIIEDDGKGVSVEKREQIFESRIKLENSEKGYGLGLSIVKKIVNVHGWAINLSDSTLGGLKVLLTIPI